MAAIDTPWVMSFTPKSIHREEDVGSESSKPTTAAFSPLTAPNTSRMQHSTIYVNQKSSLLLATPPQITRALAYSHPFLLPLNKLVGLITWSSGDPWESFLLLAVFWGTLLYGDQVIIYAGPLLVILSLLLASHFRRRLPSSSSGWSDEKQPRKQPTKNDSGITATKHQKTLDEIVETLRIFASRCHLLFDPLSQLIHTLSTQTIVISGTTNRKFATLLIIRIIIITPFWIILSLWPIQLITTRRICLFLGTIFLTWHAKPIKITRMILWRSALIRRVFSVITGLQFYPNISNSIDQSYPTNTINTPEKKNLSESEPSLTSHSLEPQGHHTPGFRFTFILHENQRRWIGLGWTTNLFSYERAAWTDEHLNPTLPKDEFKLPETNDKTTAWRWVKGSQWLVEGAEETDEGGVQASYGADGGMGWIYYDNKWEQGRRGLDGWNRFTRSRVWYRDAELVEITDSSEGKTALTTSNKSSSSLLTALKSALPYSISAPSISPPGLTPADAMSVQSGDFSPESRDTSSIKSWTSSHTGPIICKDGLKEPKTGRSCTSGISSDCAAGSCLKARTGSASHSLKREISGRPSSSESLHSNIRSGNWNDNDLLLKGPRSGDWGIGDDARMGIE